eukprot:4895139-Prymnesium_polylepis.2
MVPSLASFLKHMAPVGDSPYCAPSHSATLTFLPIIILTESTTSAVTPGASWLVTSSRTNLGKAARSPSSRFRPQPESAPIAGSIAVSALRDDLSPSAPPPSVFASSGFPPVVTGLVTHSGKDAAHATKVSCCMSVGEEAPAAFSPTLIAPATIVHTDIWTSKLLPSTVTLAMKDSGS